MRRRLALVVLLCALALPLAPTTASAIYCDLGDSVCNSLNDAKNNQQDAGARLADIQQKLGDTQAKVNALASLLRQLGIQKRAQEAAIAQTQTQLDATDRQIRLTEADIARREAHLQVRGNLLGARVRAMDKHGTVNYFELFVTARSFNQLVDRIVIMQDIIRSDQQLLDNLKQDRAQVQRLQEELTAKRAEQAALLQQQQDQKAQLDVTIGAQNSALAYFKQLESEFDAQRQQIEAEKQRIDAQVAALTVQYNAEAAKYGGGSGQFAWPLEGPITQGYGCSDLLGEPYDPRCPTRHVHQGIDIGAACGTVIHAADGGIVALLNVGYGGGYGNYIVIIHGNGFTSLYAHQQGFVGGLHQGQGVQRGQPIGYEGSTGYSTGCHLHFQIEYNGVPQNPLRYLA